MLYFLQKLSVDSGNKLVSTLLISMPMTFTVQLAVVDTEIKYQNSSSFLINAEFE